MPADQIPNNTLQYKALKEHYRSISSKNLHKLFEENRNRKQDLKLTTDFLEFDFSHQLLDTNTLMLLTDFAKQMGVLEARKHLFSGKRINHTENRPVLHTALRNFDDSPLLLDGTDIKPQIIQSRNKIKQTADAIRSKQWKGATGKNITDIVNIGIGGSYLGPQTVYEALYNASKPELKVHYLANVDGDALYKLLATINPETTLFIVVSKTFTTTETMTQAGLCKQWLQKHIPGNGLSKHLLAVTAAKEKALSFGVEEEHIYPLWDWVGGRFSVWGSVGLSIAIGLGYKVFEEFLLGGEQMDKHFLHSDIQKNIPIIAALISWWNIEMLSTHSEAVIPYNEALQFLPLYLQQLVMESNGKSVDRKGRKIHYPTAPVIFGTTGTNAQHSFMQLIHQGTQVIPVDFIGFHNPVYKEFEDSHKILNAHMQAQSHALAFGKTAAEVHLDMKIAGEQKLIEKLLPYRTFEGNRPSNIIMFDRLRPFTLGQLLALYEHKTFVQGILWNINSFDQYGVELGKELAKKLLRME